MNEYLDIKILPSADIDDNVILSMVFSKAHIALVELKSNTIGFSFPNLDKKPGNILRVHGSKESLNSFLEVENFQGMSDFVRVSEIQAIPQEHGYVNLKRVQVNLSAAQVRRLIKRGSLTEEQSEEILSKPKTLQQPFIQLKSFSTGQRYKLFFEQIKTNNSVEGSFNSFGFGSGATVPFF